MKFFDYMMRHAAPVLFWTSVLIFLGGLATSLLVERGITPYGSDSIISAEALVRAIYVALSNAALPFMGAAIIWTIQRKRDGGSE